MAKSKHIIDSPEEVKKDGGTRASKKAFTFNKNNFFDEVIELGQLGKIQFSRSPKADGAYPTYSTFVTTDSKIAKALREHAEQNPKCKIFEKQ